MTIGITEIPIEEFSLPDHVLEMLDSITDATSAAPIETPVAAGIRKPEAEEKNEAKRKPALALPIKEEADRIILACLKAEAENGSQRSGWKQQLAQKIDRHPAWVTNRIKQLQPKGKVVAE